MNRTIQIELPEDVYTSLVEAAKKAGQQPEAVAAQWLADAIHRLNGNRPDDPFAQFIGSIPTDKWANRHDELFGEHILEEMVAKDVDDAD